MGEFGAVQIPGHHPEGVNRVPCGQARRPAAGGRLGDVHRLAQARAANDPRLEAVFVRRFIALVLFLVAVGQRFRVRLVRTGANALALGLLVYGLYTASTLPRL
jgi:hypothetical protein